MSKQPRKLPPFMMRGRKKAVGSALNNIVSVPQAKKTKNLFDDTENSERRNKIAKNLNYDGVEEEEPYDRFKDLPLVKYDGKIHYLKDFYEVAEAFDGLISVIEKKEAAEECPVAFDLEWTFNYTSGPQPVAVMQVCIDLENCYIVQMTKLQKIPASLTRFLYHPRTILHGLNIKNDFRKLARDFPVFKAEPLIEKCVELGEFYNKVFNSSEKWSLNRLAIHTLREQVDKSRHLRMSNWNYSPLSQNQLLYASIDVYVSNIFKIFRQFCRFL